MKLNISIDLYIHKAKIMQNFKKLPTDKETLTKKKKKRGTTDLDFGLCHREVQLFLMVIKHVNYGRQILTWLMVS